MDRIAVPSITVGRIIATSIKVGRLTMASITVGRVTVNSGLNNSGIIHAQPENQIDRRELAQAFMSSRLFAHPHGM